MWCGEKRKRTGSHFFISAFAIAAIILPSVTVAFTPSFVEGQVAGFVFTTDPQTIEVGAVSGQITLQAQDIGGTSVNIPQTTCLSFYTASAQGQFSSSATNWSSVSVLTMNKNSANRSFFYKDTAGGTYALRVKIAFKPVEVSSSCASWPLDQWSIQWTVTQNITIGNAPQGGVSGTSTAATSEQSTNSGNSTDESAVMPPPPKVFADGGSDRTVIVGADTEFKARAYDGKKNIIDFSHFHWNFGDGSTADMATVLHHFDYPGRYIVVLDVPEEKDSVPDQIIVTVEPMKLTLSFLPDGGVAIENRAGRTLDLSRWIVRSLGRSFTIPERTLVLANSPLRISQRTLGFSSGANVELAYPNGVFAVGTAPTPVSTSTPALVSAVVPPTQQVIENKIESQMLISQDEDIPFEQPDVSTATTEATSSQVAAAEAGATDSSSMWWFGAVGIAGLAAGSLALARRFGKKEWDIIEESDRAV